MCATVSLHLMIQNSVVNDTTHGLIFLEFENASKKNQRAIEETTTKQANKATSQG